MTVATLRCSSFRLPATAERMRVAKPHAADMRSCGGRRSALIGGYLTRVGPQLSMMLNELAVANFNSAREPVPTQTHARTQPARRFVSIIPRLPTPLTSRSQACSCRRRKRREGNIGTARDGAAGADDAKPNAKARIVHIKTYVRHVTAVRIEGPKPACQGLHNGTFLRYGSSHMGDWPAACHRSPRNGFQLVAALPGG